MKKLLMAALLSSVLITTLFQPVTVGAAEEIDWKFLAEYENFLLMEEAAGQKITKVSTEPVDKETVDLGDWGYSVAVSASMDGKELVDLYSSDTPYVTKSGEKKYPAVLKADTNHTWTNNSCIIVKLEDVHATMGAMQIDMGASKDGPRDYKIEYSVDEGVTWKAFSENGTDKGCITSAGNIVTVFEKSLRSIDRDYTTKECVWNEPAIGIYNYEYDLTMYDDIYFKISIDSDYKVDGTQGIIGSDKGEIAIYDIRLFAECVLPGGSLDDSVSLGQPEQPEPEKTPEESQPSIEPVTEEKQPEPEKTPQESQPSTEPVTEEKQPDTGKTEVISQPIIDWKYLTEYENLLLMEEAAGQKITKVSTEPVDKETVDWYNAGVKHSVAISASMDGEESVDLYSSNTPYVTKSGEKKYPAVLKADTNHTWTNNSCIILKMEDVGAGVEAIQIDMGASKNGPRDYKIEYSVDEGVTWKAFSENGTDKGCITSAGNIITVFEKSLQSIDRDYTTKKCVWNEPACGIYNYEYDFKMHQDIYFKISIDSDYKVDGTQGIIGSDKGEIAIYDIQLYGPYDRPADEPEKTPEESQPSTEPVTDGKQPDTGKTEVISQPISVNQEQNIAPSNTGASGENAEQPKEKDLQTIRVKNTKKNYTVSQLKKRARSFVINISASGDPKVSFEKISGSKNLSVQKNTGKVIVKKGTKKGLYKMKVKIKVNETKEYQEKTVTKTITVRVK